MEAHQNPPWNSNGSLTDILNAHDAGPATPMPPAPGPPASHSGAPHFVGTASPVSLPAVENHATSINPNHARPSRKSTRDWKPAQPAAAPEVPKETPPWLKEMLPDVTSDQPEPKSEAKFYKAGPDTPQASFPFPVDPESAPRRQGSKLRLTSFTAPAKLEVVKEKGAFISEVLHKRGDEGEERA